MHVLNVKHNSLDTIVLFVNCGKTMKGNKFIIARTAGFAESAPKKKPSIVINVDFAIRMNFLLSINAKQICSKKSAAFAIKNFISRATQLLRSANAATSFIANALIRTLKQTSTVLSVVKAT